MKAIRVHRFGGPEVLSYEEILGYSNIGMTIGVYSHVLLTMQRT